MRDYARIAISIIIVAINLAFLLGASYLIVRAMIAYWHDHHKFEARTVAHIDDEDDKGAACCAADSKRVDNCITSDGYASSIATVALRALVSPSTSAASRAAAPVSRMTSPLMGASVDRSDALDSVVEMSEPFFVDQRAVPASAIGRDSGASTTISSVHHHSMTPLSSADDSAVADIVDDGPLAPRLARTSKPGLLRRGKSSLSPMAANTIAGVVSFNK